MFDFKLYNILVEDLVYLNESEAAEQAKQLGLKYVGYGYWEDSTGLKVARTIDGKLVKLNGQDFDPEHHEKSKQASAKAGLEMAKHALNQTMAHAIDYIGIDLHPTDPLYKQLQKLIIQTIEDEGNAPLTGSQNWAGFDPSETKMIKKYLAFVASSDTSPFFQAIKNYTDSKKQAQVPDEEPVSQDSAPANDFDNPMQWPHDEPSVDTTKPETPEEPADLIKIAMQLSGTSKATVMTAWNFVDNVYKAAQKWAGGPAVMSVLSKTNLYIVASIATLMEKPTLENREAFLNKLHEMEMKGLITPSYQDFLINAMTDVINSNADAPGLDDAWEFYNHLLAVSKGEAIPKEKAIKIVKSLDKFLKNPTEKNKLLAHQTLAVMESKHEIDSKFANAFMAGLQKYFQENGVEPKQKKAVIKAKDIVQKIPKVKAAAPAMVNNLEDLATDFLVDPSQEAFDAISAKAHILYATGKLSDELRLQFLQSLQPYLEKDGSAGSQSTPSVPQGPQFDVKSTMDKMGLHPGDPNYDFIHKYIEKAADSTLNYGVYNVGQLLKKKGYITPEQWKILLKATKDAKGGLINKYYIYKKKKKAHVAQPLAQTPGAPKVKATIGTYFPTLELDKSVEGQAAESILTNILGYGGDWLVGMPEEAGTYLVAGLKAAINAPSDNETLEQIASLADEFEIPQFAVDKIKTDVEKWKKSLHKTTQSSSEDSFIDSLTKKFFSDIDTQNAGLVQTINTSLSDAMNAGSNKDAYAYLTLIPDMDNEKFDLLWRAVSKAREKLFGVDDYVPTPKTPEPEAPTSPTPLEQPSQATEKPDFGAHTALELDADEHEEIMQVLEKAHDLTGYSLKNNPDSIPEIMQLVHSAIDSGGAEGVMKLFDDFLKTGSSVPTNYLDHLENVILNTWGWGNTEVPSAESIPEPDVSAFPPSIIKAVDTLMGPSKFTQATTPAEKYDLVMSWLGKQLSKASKETGYQSKASYKELMNAMNAKYGHLSPALAAAKQKDIPVPTKQEPESDNYEKEIAKVQGELEQLKQQSMAPVIKAMDDSADKVAKEFFSSLGPEWGENAKQNILAAIRNGFKEDYYESMKPKYLKPLMKMPGFKRADYEKLKYMMKPIMQNSDSSINQAKAHQEQLLAVKKLKLKNLMIQHAEEIAKKNKELAAKAELELHKDLYGDMIVPSVTPYKETPSPLSMDQRMNNVIDGWLATTGFGLGQVPENERTAILSRVLAGLEVADQQKVNDIITKLHHETSLNDQQISKIRELVHQERKSPGSLPKPPSPTAGKGSKAIVPKGKDLFTTKFTLAQLGPEKHKQARELLASVIKNPALIHHVRSQLQDLGVPLDVRNRWTKWASKLGQSGATINDKGLVVMPGANTTDTHSSFSLPAGVKDASGGRLTKVLAKGEVVKVSQYLQYEGGNENAHGISSGGERAITQRTQREKTLSSAMYSKFMNARGLWQASGQWNYSPSERKMMNAVFTKVIEGPPPELTPVCQPIERGMRMSHDDFDHFIKAFAVGEKVYLGPSGFSEGKDTPRNAAAFSNASTVPVLLRIKPDKKGQIKGSRLQCYDHSSEREIVTGTSRNLRVLQIIKHAFPSEYGAKMAMAYEIVMEQENDELYEAVGGQSPWAGMDRETIKTFLKYLNSSIHQTR
jgi:hypothetical protein